MLIEINYKLLENNQCPGCMAPFFREGTGYDRGIHCNHCGFLTTAEKYQEVMRPFIKKKFMSSNDDDEVN